TLTSRSSISVDGGVAPHHLSPTSAMEPAGQDLGARMRSGLTTVLLQLRPNASPFWIMLLLTSAEFGRGIIDANRTPGTAPDYESGGQEFESLRARHLVLVCEHQAWPLCLARTAFSSNSLLPLIRI